MTLAYIEHKRLGAFPYVMQNTESFGERLARLRARKGLTQDALADLVPTTSTTISRYERGEIGLPKGKALGALAAAVGVSIDELLNGVEAVAAAAPSDAPDPHRELVDRVIEDLGCTEAEATKLRSIEWGLFPPTYHMLRSLVAEARLNGDSFTKSEGASGTRAKGDAKQARAK